MKVKTVSKEDMEGALRELDQILTAGGFPASMRGPFFWKTLKLVASYAVDRDIEPVGRVNSDDRNELRGLGLRW